VTVSITVSVTNAWSVGLLRLCRPDFVKSTKCRLNPVESLDVVFVEFAL
jgi:hypothetical protein